MSLVWCREHREIEISEEGPKAKGKRKFLARVTERTDGRAVIAASPDLPTQFSSYDGMICVGRTFRRYGSKGFRLWEIELDYDTDVPQSKLDAFNNPNPVNRPCTIDVVTIREQIAVNKGRDGAALVNVLGRPYDPPLMKWRTRLRFECEKAVTAYPAWYFNLLDRINRDPFTIRGETFDPKTVMFCSDRIPDKVKEGDYAFFKARFALDWTPDGWDPDQLQADVYCVGDSGGIERIYEDGEPVTSPRKLDAFGAVIDSDDPDDIFFEKEEIQELGNFGVLTAVLA